MMTTFRHHGDVWQVFEYGDGLGTAAHEGHRVYLICEAKDQRLDVYVSHPDPSCVPVAELRAAIDRNVISLT
jgi:hypothetical protein